jgi:YidC/Oxa1 family membrane protein insertase
VNIFDIVIVQPLFNAMLLIYSLIPGGDFGVALIILTIIIRFLLYPLVKRQLHQTKMMRKLQPELKKIKAASKGDRQKEAIAMMDMYKRYGVSPFRSIGILLLQMPIFIGLYFVVQIFTLHRDRFEEFTYSFLHNIKPISDLLANPEKLNLHLFGAVDLSKSAMQSGDVILFLLAIAAAATQFIMSRQLSPTGKSDKTFRSIMQEAAKGNQADQSEINAVVMQNMMKIMPVFMFFVMITVPGALALYYGVSNIVAVLQQAYLLRQDEEELEEIADEPTIKKAKTSKKSTNAKTRQSKAKEGNITRIVAKDKRQKRR